MEKLKLKTCFTMDQNKVMLDIFPQNLITCSIMRFTHCAAKAFYSCPAIISRRPGSQNTPKESQLNPEEDSRIKQARSHVTLEKSSKNYKPSEE
jgi:hypothetical protein